jgi:hypothetical protein
MRYSVDQNWMPVTTKKSAERARVQYTKVDERRSKRSCPPTVCGTSTLAVAVAAPLTLAVPAVPLAALQAAVALVAVPSTSPEMLVVLSLSLSLLHSLPPPTTTTVQLGARTSAILGQLSRLQRTRSLVPQT